MRVLKALIVAFALAGVGAAPVLAQSTEKHPTQSQKDTGQQPQNQEGTGQKSN